MGELLSHIRPSRVTEPLIIHSKVRECVQEGVQGKIQDLAKEINSTLATLAANGNASAEEARQVFQQKAEELKQEITEP